MHGHPAFHIWVIFQVEPFASLSEAVQKSVPRLLINRDLVGPFALSPRRKDVVQLGDVVHGVERLVDLLGWTQELQDLMQREHGKVRMLSFGPSPADCILSGCCPKWLLAFRRWCSYRPLLFAPYSTTVCWDRANQGWFVNQCHSPLQPLGIGSQGTLCVVGFTVPVTHRK